LSKGINILSGTAAKNWTVASYLVQGQGVFFGKSVAGRRGRKTIVAADWLMNISTGDSFVPPASEHVQDHLTWLSKDWCGSA